MLDEAVQENLVSRVTREGYAANLTDDEVEGLGRDPFLVAYALADLGRRCIVTTEVSRPRRTRANRHIPDVCSDFEIPCFDTFELVRMLDFRTNRV